MTDDYVLGVEPEELARLGTQHATWREPMLAALAAAGLRAGHRALDLGAGPGFTTLELARLVGPRGSVVARERSAPYLAHLAAERERLALPWIEPSPGEVEDLDLPPASVDLAYARWLLCWLPEPGRALAPVARALRPGGALVVQDYLDWAAMKLVPRSAVFDRAVDACMASWRAAGGHIDVTELLPALAPEHGLAVERFAPIARAGAPGSPEWSWLSDFFRVYLPKLVARGTYPADEQRAFRAEWEARAADGRSLVVTPVVADVVLRRR